MRALSPASLLARWGRLVARHPWRVVLVWVALVVVGLGLAGGAVGDSLFQRLHSGQIRVTGETQTGEDALSAAGSQTFVTYTLTVNGVRLGDTTTVAAATRAASVIGALPAVASVANPWAVPGGVDSAAARTYLRHGSASSDGFATVVTFRATATSEDVLAVQPQVDAALDRLVRDTGAPSSARGGGRQLVDAITGQVKQDLAFGEGIALPVTFAVMVLVFGGFVAAGLPLVGAIASIAGALGTLLGFSHLLDLDATVVNIVTILGLGLCIDYGLLLVSRYREELRCRLQGRSVDELTREEVVDAVGATLHRAGRTVLFSAVTVAISLAGLLFFRADIMQAIGAAGVSVVVLSLGVALTLIPALCRLAARRLLRGGTDTAPDQGVFSRLAAGVQRMPWVVIAAVLAVLVVGALPATSLQMTSSGHELLPVGSPDRAVFDTLSADYPALSPADVTVVGRGTTVHAVQTWARSAEGLPGVLGVTPATPVGDLLTVGIHVRGGPLGPEARALTSDLRAHRPPFAAYVVGQASGVQDFVDSTWDRAPYAISTVTLATLVLLFLLTGSVIIPVKALLMNVLSLGASLGAVTWVFQDGHLEGLLRFTSVGAVEQVIPLLVLAFGFGLSMDYEMFLLSRVVELHERGDDTDAAVRLGLQRSGRIITSAALLMVIVFGGFVTAQVLVIKETGVALVLAVFIDATLVRMLLVPATMTVLGNLNWWAPAALRRLHLRFGITG